MLLSSAISTISAGVSTWPRKSYSSRGVSVESTTRITSSVNPGSLGQRHRGQEMFKMLEHARVIEAANPYAGISAIGHPLIIQIFLHGTEQASKGAIVSFNLMEQ